VHDTVRLAHVDHFSPFATAAQGKSEGAAIAILNEAVARVDLKAIYIADNLDRVQELVRAGHVDGIAVFAITPQRKEMYDFTEPILTTGGALFVRKSVDRDPSSPEEWSGGVVCTPFKGPLAAHIRERYPQVMVRDAKDYSAALDMVVRGEADAAALNFHVAARLAQELHPGRFAMPTRVFLETPLAVAFLKGQKPRFLARVSAGIRQVKKEAIYRQILQSALTSSV
jgi:polar amino acid transport system substrate-binding protein